MEENQREDWGSEVSRKFTERMREIMEESRQDIIETLREPRIVFE